MSDFWGYVEAHADDPEPYLRDLMLTDVKVAYRLVEMHGPPVGDEAPHDAEFMAAVDAEFDRWLRGVKAAAWAEGFDAGERDVFEHERTSFDAPCIKNPYRSES